MSKTSSRWMMVHLTTSGELHVALNNYAVTICDLTLPAVTTGTWYNLNVSYMGLPYEDLHCHRWLREMSNARPHPYLLIMMNFATCYDFKTVTDCCVEPTKHYDRNQPPRQKLLRTSDIGFEATCEKLIGGD